MKTHSCPLPTLAFPTAGLSFRSQQNGASSERNSGFRDLKWSLPVILAHIIQYFFKMCFSNSIPGHIYRKDENSPLQGQVHTSAHTLLFTISKTQKQPKCPSTEEWIKKIWSIYTMGYYSAIKKEEENNVICSDTDGHRDYHTKWSKSDRERQVPYDITYMWSLIKWYRGTSLMVQWLRIHLPM